MEEKNEWLEEENADKEKRRRYERGVGIGTAMTVSCSADELKIRLSSFVV